MYKNSYIDESGDIGHTKKSTKYFIVTAICTDDVKSLRHIAKVVQRHKKDKNKTSILHAYKENNKTKDMLVNRLKNVNISCVVCAVDKQQKPKDTNFYMFALEEIARYCNKIGVAEIVIARLDTRKSYQINIIAMFRQYSIQAVFSNPASEKALQIADFYSWSVFSHLELGNSEYFTKLKNSITLI